MPTIPKSKRPMWAGERKPFERMAQKNESFYNSTAWRNLAKAHKAAFRLCVNHKVCKGVVHTTDHIKPINEGGDPFAWDNLQSLCDKCNPRKTGRQSRRGAANKYPYGGGVKDWLLR